MKSSLSKWQPGWYLIGAAVVGGLVLGYELRGL